MGWSFNIGSIAGTAIRLHITFLLFLLWVFFESYVSGGAGAAWQSLVFIVLLFTCVVAHEFGHILTARQFGVTPPTVTLLPIGGVAQLERIPEKPWEEFLVAIAGPIVNVVIAAALVLLFGASLEAGNLAAMGKASVGMTDRLAAVNLFLALFNMIPAFPMDGGRVLRAALASRLGYTRATEIAASIGQFSAFVLGFLRLFGNALLIFIAIFVYLAAASEAQLLAVRAISTLLRTSQSEFPVVDAAGKPGGVVGRSDLIRALKEHGPDARVADVMSPISTVGHRAWLDEAFQTLQQKAATAVAVVDAN